MDGDNGHYSFGNGLLLIKDGTILYKCLRYGADAVMTPPGITTVADYAFLDCE